MVRWFDVDPCYVFHLGGAHTDARGRIVVDGAPYTPADTAAMWGSIGGSATPGASAAALGVARLHRWTLDPAIGTVVETSLDDRPVEFPTLDDRLVGRASRYLYAVSASNDNPSSAAFGSVGVTRGTAIVKYDEANGSVTEHRLAPGIDAGEAVFVPARGGTAEDDGWLLTITTRYDGSASQLLVLDASDVAGPPVAAVALPRGVPAGFHGSLITDELVGE